MFSRLIPGTDGTLMMSVSHAETTPQVVLAWHRQRDAEAYVTITADPLRFTEEVVRLRDHSVGHGEFATLSVVSLEVLPLTPSGLVTMMWDRDMDAQHIQITMPVMVHGNQPLRMTVDAPLFMESAAALRQYLQPQTV